MVRKAYINQDNHRQEMPNDRYDVRSRDCHAMDAHMSCVRPDMWYCSRSRCFHPNPGTKHISVPPRHMTKSYAPDFQHDIITLQIQGYNISYNRHTTALNIIQHRKIYVWYRLQANA